MKLRYSILIATVIFCAACNTVQGLGKDMKKVGAAVEHVGKKP